MKYIRVRLRKYLSLVMLAFLAVHLSGCSSDKEKPELSVSSVSLYAERDANQNSAIAVDLVLVYNPELARTVGEMSAAKYFESAGQLLLDNPTLIEIWRWELVPGQIVQDFEISQRQGDAFRGYVFANYLTPGSHRIRVHPNGEVGILLLKDDMKNLAAYDYHNLTIGKTASDARPSKDTVRAQNKGHCVKPGPGLRPSAKSSGPSSILTTPLPPLGKTTKIPKEGTQLKSCPLGKGPIPLVKQTNQ